ncbi:MAG TPA: lysoplasmalogenase family protein [Allosphingosinicella sp.]
MTGPERLLVAISLAGGLGYPLLWSQPMSPVAMIALKGAGVGLLALAAAMSARSLDRWLLASLLALGAAGDVLIEIDLASGASAFATGHIVAIILYLRNRRAAVGPLDRAIAALLPAAATALPYLLLRERPEAVAFALYALFLGGMAASAWMSRFPRRLVALGALLFLASDMLIALRMAADLVWLSLPIWLLYYVGQLLIFLGVASALPPRERSLGGAGPPKAVEG